MYVARQALCVLVVAGLLGGLFAGCGQRTFTRPHYETIIIGTSTESDVEWTLGKATQKNPDTWTYIHEKPWFKAEIHFQDGVVVDKTWYDEKGTGQSRLNRVEKDK